MGIFKKLLTANHIFAIMLILVIVGILGYFWINDQYKEFKLSSLEITNIYNNQQSNIKDASQLKTILAQKQYKLDQKIKSDINVIIIILLSILFATIILIELWNIKLRNSFKEFIEFFQTASTENIYIDDNKVHFDEFRELTHLANNMVALREKFENRLKEQAYKDPLTQSYNRRYFYEIAETLLNLAKREKTPLCIVMIDIDKFKNINDTYGHIIGDEVIILLAKRLEELVRGSDIVARFGGEEFAIIFPKSNIKDTKAIAEKIRVVIENEVLQINQLKVRFTISLGVSEFDYEHNKTIESMLEKADNALYVAKESGRNQVY